MRISNLRFESNKNQVLSFDLSQQMSFDSIDILTFSNVFINISSFKENETNNADTNIFVYPRF